MLVLVFARFGRRYRTQPIMLIPVNSTRLNSTELDLSGTLARQMEAENTCGYMRQELVWMVEKSGVNETEDKNVRFALPHPHCAEQTPAPPKKLLPWLPSKTSQSQMDVADKNVNHNLAPR